MTKKLQLKLYTRGRILSSLRAIDNAQRICEGHIVGKYDLTVIDVLEHPEVLETENIIETPILIREWPLPKVRILGDLTDTDLVVEKLELQLF